MGDPVAGSEVVFAVHLPLLRIDAESLPFAGGDLWRMPWATFDALTAGAWADHQQAYDTVAPVFYRFVARAGVVPAQPLPASDADPGQLQIKLPIARWPLLQTLGLGFLQRFHTLAADPVWQALLLEAPAIAWPRPRWSLSFAIADAGWGFATADGVHRVVSVRGDADAEYLLTPAFRGVPLDTAALARAAAWVDRLDGSTLAPPLQAAVLALGDTASPLLGAPEQLTLATVALESLLLPELRSGLARRLADRLAVLLGGNDTEAQALLRSQAMALYDIRSASLHGQALPAQAEAAIGTRLGSQLLARAVQALQGRLDAGGGTPDAVLAALDAGTPGPAPGRPGPAASRQALHDTRLARVVMVGSGLESPAGQWLMWAPLVGLQCHTQLALGEPPAPVLTPFSGHELLLLEDRDVARDTDGRVRLLDERIAVMALLLPQGEAPDAAQALQRLERWRDLAVAALRLAGCHAFHDPALGGAVLVQGAQRWRRASVLRQSLWQMLLDLDAHPVLRADDAALVAPHWRLLRDYERRGGHPDLERALALYRRGFDCRFTPPDAVAALQFALLEALLGRFRAPGQRPSLETLVQRLLGPQHAAAAWFAAEGRALRNAIAHGRGGAGDGLHAALDAINGHALAQALALWLAAPAHSATRPATLLIQNLTGDGDT